MNASLILWIAGILAAAFVIAIIVDSIRRKRAKAKKKRGHHADSGEHREPGFFKSISLFQRQVGKEWGRRRRHRERARDRER